ncbi:diacylglycerol kinase [Acinetobacter qingfengensis]|uniref:Diacylglycerol kinase n=1 Tax=Acinetobacter qingfengensis TaxID=1262585 RepID=A0A1E7R5T9_9GAMM|nr:diacylglycerol kinase family protein [Acinetobacter qingfengensis]KAA8735228.1 diacylglycerol kinase [Acinetobacter qingfengensis]OEY94623.1 diacylglycerol kinase [Acinetobacter qingfengensis]
MHDPLSIVMNTGSGHHGHGHQVNIEKMVEILSAANYAVALFLTDQVYNLDQCIAEAIKRHQSFPKGQRGIIVAAGGDGTINSVVQALLGLDIQLGILPLGTFNYVARALNIPLNIDEATQVLVDGDIRSIHVAQVNHRVYLNNASIGLYPVIIESREYYNQKIGRFPAVAYLSGLVELIKPFYHFRLKLRIDGKLHPVDSPMIFFGNNQLQLQDLKLRLADCAAQGKLAGVALGQVNRWQLLQLILKLFQGELERADDVYGFCADQVEIESKQRTLKVALDGEIVQLTTPLKFAVCQNAVIVKVPHVITSI